MSRWPSLSCSAALLCAQLLSPSRAGASNGTSGGCDALATLLQQQPGCCTTSLTPVEAWALHPPCARAISQQSQSTAVHICLHSFPSCHQRLSWPSLLIYFFQWEQTRHLHLFPGVFWFSGSSFLTTFEPFQPCARSPLVKWICSLLFFKSPAELGVTQELTTKP